MFRFRSIVTVIRSAGLAWATVVFLVIFAVCASIIAFLEPSIKEGDALWSCFQAVVTIGYGDVVPTTPAGRLAIVVLSLFSVFYLAVITGAVVTWCQDGLRTRRDESVAAFIDQLEHLEDLDKDQLAELSRKIRSFRRSGLPNSPNQ